MQKYGVIFDMTCNKLIFWPEHCQYSWVKKLLEPHAKKLYSELHAKKLHVLTLNLKKLIKKILSNH